MNWIKKFINLGVREEEEVSLDKFIEDLDDQKEWWDTMGSDNKPEFSGNAILFVGSTKQGKSTLINCLLGNPLLSKYDRGSGEWLLENKPEAGYQPKISATGMSETSRPTLYRKRNLKLWDMPGLNDNKGLRSELKKSAMAKLVISKHDYVSFVLVVEQGIISQKNPMPFVELISLLLKYSPDIGNHLYIVISKSKKNNWASLLNTFLDKKTTSRNENNTQIDRAKAVVRQVIENESGFSFLMPNFKNENETHIYESFDKQLLTKISSVPKIRIDNCPYVFGETYRPELLKFRENVVSENSQNFSEVCRYFISESRIRIMDCDHLKKNEKLKYLNVYSEILPTSPMVMTFLKFVGNNTSCIRDTQYYPLINDLKSKFISLEKIEEILGDSQLLRSQINATIHDVINILDDKIRDVRNEVPPPEGGCNIQ